MGTTPSASAAPTPAAQPSTPRAAEGFVAGVYNIRAIHSGKCLAPQDDSTGEGVPIHQQPCDGRPSQRVSLEYFGRFNGWAHYAIVTDSGKCWGENRGIDGAPLLYDTIFTASCDTYWKRIAYSLRKGHPWDGAQIHSFDDPDEYVGTLCLHVHNASAGDGAGLLTHFCNNPGTGSRNDTFEFIPV
ncbi:RICIN domain-containing protein [Streptomyces sp. NPDC020965]|uniref:RICIN domain-containing protein n=1 Tax=Streptomyces sp. NPDC020965 TaxID=3365105 RepID=UPI00378EF8F9